eukprot:3622380-Prymnesium_polylepis.1
MRCAALQGRTRNACNAAVLHEVDDERHPAKVRDATVSAVSVRHTPPPPHRTTTVREQPKAVCTRSLLAARRALTRAQWAPVDLTLTRSTVATVETSQPVARKGRARAL